jgi:hypothetical protein
MSNVAEYIGRLIHVIEQQTKVLLDVEWGNLTVDNDAFTIERQCPCCYAHAHRPHTDCDLDAALCAVGLDTDEKRDKARGTRP